MLFLYFLCVLSTWFFLLGHQYQCKWLTGKSRLRNDLYVLMGTLNPTHSLTHSSLNTWLLPVFYCDRIIARSGRETVKIVSSWKRRAHYNITTKICRGSVDGVWCMMGWNRLVENDVNHFGPLLTNIVKCFRYGKSYAATTCNSFKSSSKRR